MGKKKKNKTNEEPSDDKGESQQKQQQNPISASNTAQERDRQQAQKQQKSQQGALTGDQQKKSGSSQQQQRGAGDQQRDRGPQQQQRATSGPQQQQQQQQHRGGRYQEQRAPGPQQQQQRATPGPQQEQQRGAHDQQHQQHRGGWHQEQRAPGPQQQQQRATPGPQKEQQRGAYDQQQQQHRGGRYQEQRAPGPQQQQQRATPGPQQEQQRGAHDQQHQQHRGGWHQEQRAPGPQQQQQRATPGPQKEQQRGAYDQQQQQHRGGRYQEQRAPGPQQQQQRAPGPPGYGQQQNPQQGGWRQDQQGRSQQTAQLSQQMGKLSISSESPLPVMKTSCNGIARGTLGTPGILEVNYLRLNLDKMPDEAYHYDVCITPDRPKKFLRTAFEQFRLEMCPDVIVAFDGFKSCYTMQRLNSPMERKIEVNDTNNRKKEFLVQVKETDTCVVDLKALRHYQNERVFDKPMRALQVLEVVLASNNHERGIRVGRSFFRRPNEVFSLEDGYEAWTGLYQAAILGEIPLLNVDIAHKSFPAETSLIAYLDNMRIDKNRELPQYCDIHNFLRGINIVYNPPESFGATPKQFKVLSIGLPASRRTFKNEDGKELTVEKYYQSRGYKLKYPNLNCIDVGSTVRTISIPMELCSIPGGQVLNRKDQSRQVEKMVRYAATSTNIRKRKIMELLRYFDHNVNSIIRAFGLTIGENFIKVPFRILTSPCLEYLQGQTVTTVRGAWRMDNKKFLICSKPQNDHRWAILYEDKARISHHELENFKSNVIKTSQSLNMNLQNSADIKSYNFRELKTTLIQLARDGYDLVFVVLSDRGTPYSKIKQIAELEVGILTQCIKDKTVFRTARDRTVFSNILLKVNGKINGTNHKIAQDRSSNLLAPLKNVMYLGADVTHPSPDQRHIPSVVGVAASHDPNGACYNCQYRLQRSTVENIEDMESIVCRHLEMYYKYQKSYPGQIIYYRDGVSDGQFPIVEREEIRAIKSACNKMRCNPKVTCVIVVKRHHTRFFPLKQPQHDKDFNNVEAGTVVDQHITHPNEVQFFMVSHQSIQGTARPTRYNVIMDESNFNIDMLQKLTYNLCHLFPRCNRAVSYPAPAYLAHLVAFRGRVYLEGTQKFGNLRTEYERRQIRPDFMNKNPMYFI